MRLRHCERRTNYTFLNVTFYQLSILFLRHLRLSGTSATVFVFEIFSAEWQAGHAWTVSRSCNKACWLSGHFRLCILRPDDLGLFGFHFQSIKNTCSSKQENSATVAFGAVQKCVNLVDLEECCNLRICLQKSALITPRTSPDKFTI